jgi:hypothetical protein
MKGSRKGREEKRAYIAYRRRRRRRPEPTTHTKLFSPFSYSFFIFS